MRPENFADLLRSHRRAIGFSQEHLAELASLSPAAIGALERGARRRPQRETVVALSNALRLDAERHAQFEDAAARGRKTSAPSRATSNNLPHSITRMVGREKSLSELQALLGRDDARLVTIVGTGGVGKTRLAIDVARSLELEYANDVGFIELGTLAPEEKDASVQQIASAIGAVVGVRERATGGMLDALTQALRMQRMLLIVDNCEHVLDGATTVLAQILRSCPQIRLLATSRAALRIAGERRYHLGPLVESAAIELFCQRAHAVDNSTPMLEDEEVEIVADIVRRLDGNPLAIELVAARRPTFTLRELAEGIGDRFQLLVLGNRDAPPRHQSLRALVDWSYDKLSAQEQIMLQCLSIFYGGCTAAAAAAVFSCSTKLVCDTRELLSTLTENSMIKVRSRAQPRYHLLETIQRYAFEKAEASGSRSRASHEHARYFLSLAEREPSHWLGLDETGEWFARLNADLANFRAALTWTLAEGNDPIVGARLIVVLRKFFRFVSMVECDYWADLADRRLPASAPAELRADLACCFEAGGAHVRLNGVSVLEEAVATYASLQLNGKQATALAYLANAYARNGRFDEAEAAAAESVALARKVGNKNELANALTVQSFACRDETERQTIEAEAKAMRPADPTYDLYAQALTELRRGNHAGARAHVRAAVELLERWPSIYVDNRALFQVEIAWRSLSLDDVDEAHDAAEKALALGVQLGSAEIIVESIYALATIAANLDVYETGARLFGFCEEKIAPRTHTCAEDVPLIEAALERIRSAMPESNRNELWAIGMRLTEGEAIEEAFSLAGPDVLQIG